MISGQSAWDSVFSGNERKRYYSLTYGRFLSPDPYRASGGLADPGSWNRYAYSSSDSINFNDPEGLDIIYVNTPIMTVTGTATPVPTSMSDFIMDASRYYPQYMLSNGFHTTYAELLGRQTSAQIEDQYRVLYPVGGNGGAAQLRAKDRSLRNGLSAGMNWGVGTTNQNLPALQMCNQNLCGNCNV